jgi:hypothetical protein
MPLRTARAQSKLSNKVGLQDGTYAGIRRRFGLPAQMACSEHIRQQAV